MYLIQSEAFNGVVCFVCVLFFFCVTFLFKGEKTVEMTSSWRHSESLFVFSLVRGSEKKKKGGGGATSIKRQSGGSGTLLVGQSPLFSFCGLVFTYLFTDFGYFLRMPFFSLGGRGGVESRDRPSFNFSPTSGRSGVIIPPMRHGTFFSFSPEVKRLSHLRELSCVIRKASKRVVVDE